MKVHCGFVKPKMKRAGLCPKRRGKEVKSFFTEHLLFIGHKVAFLEFSSNFAFISSL